MLTVASSLPCPAASCESSKLPTHRRIAACAIPKAWTGPRRSAHADPPVSRDTPVPATPAGAEIRYLMEGTTGNMIHSTVPPGQVNRATVHATVSEFWHVLSCREGV